MKLDKVRTSWTQKNNPYITFKSTKIAQAGTDTFEVDGDFTIRGVTRSEKLQLKVTGAGTGSGTIDGSMAFDRKEHGMNSGIPLIKCQASRSDCRPQSEAS